MSRLYPSAGGVGISVVTALLMTTSALAQEPVSDIQRGTRLANVEEVVVTARRREESIQDVPVSISVLDANVIARYSISDLSTIASLTPQLNVVSTPSGAGAQFTLRGVGSSSTSVGIEQSVAVVVDSVYYASGRVINSSMLDLERVEILKGPQALFFGKNATAGVISLTTADPTDELEIKTKAGFEIESEQLYGEFVGSTPISDKFGVRVALRGAKQFDGFVKNRSQAQTFETFDVGTGDTNSYTAPAAPSNSPGGSDFAGRVTFKWTPTDQLTGTLKVNGSTSRANNPAWGNIVYSCPGGFSTLDPGTPCTRDFVIHMNKYPEEMAENTIHHRDFTNLFHRYYDWGVTGTISYEFDSATLTSVTNYQRNRNAFGNDGDYQSGPNPTPTFAGERSVWRAFSNETRIMTEYDSPINALVGVLYQRTKRDNLLIAHTAGLEDSTAPDGYRYLAFANESATKGETAALFGQAVWNPVDVVEVAAGVRYTHETKDSYYFRPYVNSALSGIFPVDRIEADQTFDNWSPEITVTYTPIDEVTLYGAYKTAYKSGGFSNSSNISAFGDPGDLDFEPETAEGFEGGVKTSLLDNQLRLDLAVYRYKYKDLQVDFYNSPNLSFITTNAGSAVTKGVEMEFAFRPRQIANLGVRGTVNYNKANYTEYLAPCWSGQRPAEGCTTVVFGIPGQDLAGAPLAIAPRWTGSLGVDYGIDVSENWWLSLAADARYSDNYIASSFGNPNSRQPSYISLDAAARLQSADDRWELAVIGRNLTNRFIVNGGIDGTGTGSGTGTPAGVPADQYGWVSPPRTVYLELSWRY